MFMISQTYLKMGNIIILCILYFETLVMNKYVKRIKIYTTEQELKGLVKEP